jgi:hypothetical protein
MRWIDKTGMRLQLLLHRGREAGRLDAELQDHLKHQIAENLASGMGAEEARQAALRSFGNPTLLREQARESWSWNWVEALIRDVRIGTRTLLRTPGFALTAILVMALGIGANVALFTLVRSVLLRPLPFADQDRLVQVFEARADGRSNPVVSRAWRLRNRLSMTWRARGISFLKWWAQRWDRGICCRCWGLSRRWADSSRPLRISLEPMPRWFLPGDCGSGGTAEIQALWDVTF